MSPDLIAACITAVRREQQRLSLQALLGVSEAGAAVKLLEPLTIPQGKLMIDLIAAGDHWQASASLASRVPDHLIELAERTIHEA